MSKSRHSSARPTKLTTVPPVVPDVRAKPPMHPWVIGGIDYGPAIAAVHDLASWAFDLALRDVAHWPEGQRRVKIARRFVLARLHGKRWRRAPSEDVLFTTGLLTRIFDADLRLGMSEVVAILDRLGLPTELVPLMPRRQANASAPMHPPFGPIMPRRQANASVPMHPPFGPITPLRPRPSAAAVAPTPHDYCDECGRISPHFRNAA